MSCAAVEIAQLARDGFFDVRPDGTIWRLRTHTRTGRVREIAPARADMLTVKGYRVVVVRVVGKLYRAMAHRIVWTYHCGPIAPNTEINHKDGGRDHNWLDNLEPLSHGLNQAHSYRELNRVRMQGPRNGSARLTEDDARRILALKGTGTQRAIGARFGVSKFAVYRIWNGKGWSHLDDAMPEVRP